MAEGQAQRRLPPDLRPGRLRARLRKRPSTGLDLGPGHGRRRGFVSGRNVSENVASKNPGGSAREEKVEVHNLLLSFVTCETDWPHIVRRTKPFSMNDTIALEI